MHARILNATITFAATIALGLTGAVAVAAEGDQVPLTTAELTTLLSGQTETWSTLGAGYYDPAGEIAFMWKDKPGSGAWKIIAQPETDTGILCLKITAWYGDDFNCGWSYFREDGDIFSLNLKTDKATKIPGFAPGKTF
jgi:hypothetical protein